MEFIPDVRVIPYEGLFRSSELSTEMQALARNGGIALLRNHGAIFVAENFEEVVYLAYYFEEACRIQCLVNSVVSAPILPDERIVLDTAKAMKGDRREAADALYKAFERVSGG
jgi:ribulose-5-phosphate 4-epimerase/fuculose-1-phosphate aldolase